MTFDQTFRNPQCLPQGRERYETQNFITWVGSPCHASTHLLYTSAFRKGLPREAAGEYMPGAGRSRSWACQAGFDSAPGKGHMLRCQEIARPKQLAFSRASIDELFVAEIGGLVGARRGLPMMPARDETCAHLDVHIRWRKFVKGSAKHLL